jgi:hypothetical protein
MRSDVGPDNLTNTVKGTTLVCLKKCLSLQADVEITDWPPRAPDMNLIKNMWSNVKRTMQETWPVLPPRKSYEL